MIFHYPLMERVHIGAPFAETIAAEADRLAAKRIFLMVGGTLSRETDWVAQLAEQLDGRLVGSWNRMAAHTPRTDVIAATAAARAAQPDLLVTLGGGSVTDAGKMVRLCLANDVTAPEQLDRFVTVIDGRRRHVPEKRAPAPAALCVPTTLSAGEYTAAAGCTDTARNEKQPFSHPRMMAAAVILDPAVTLPTPLWLFLSTGIRAVDHAVEDICSINGNPYSEGASLQALRLLARGLRAAHADPASLPARLDCLTGAWMSMVGSQSGVEKGASHGIGHALGGTAGMPHGYTSCVMLPHVLRYNSSVTAPQQALVSQALGAPGVPAGELVAELVRDLGLPARLRDADVRQDQLDEIADVAMHDRWIPTNPRPLDRDGVRKLLDAAW